MANHLEDDRRAFDRAFAEATERGHGERGIRARSARYERETGRVVVELGKGCTFAFPTQLAQGLRGADPELLEQVEIAPPGTGLHWEELDVDLSIPGLLQGVFGTREWMRELGRAGGSVRSEAKARAARINGRKGGRPRKRRT